VVRESFRQLVTCGQVDAQSAKSLPEFRTVSVEKIAKTDAVDISAPLQEHFEQIGSPNAKSESQRAAGFEVGVVAVAQE
jgi:hypothetical protein